MRRTLRGAATAAGAALAALGLVTGGGCRHQVQYDTTVTHAEEFHAAPSEERYNNAPELGYRKPPPKKEFKPSFGGGAGGPAGSGGMGAMQ